MSKLEIGDNRSLGCGLVFDKSKREVGAFIVSAVGHGFEATRYLNADDLREIRDWINRELGEGE